MSNHNKLLAVITDIVRKVILEEFNIKYQAAYPAVIVASRGEGTSLLLDVRIDPIYKIAEAWSNVRIKLGIPGVLINKVKNGTKCLVEFENANPLLPVIRSVEQISESEIIYTYNNADDAVVLNSKLVDYINNTVKIAFDTHIHNSPIGPTSPPVTPLTAVGDIASETILVDK